MAARMVRVRPFPDILVFMAGLLRRLERPAEVNALIREFIR
ncbi:MAG: hypothetical protein ABIP09_03055 [Gemmatimonadaceae bacterium]